MKSKEMQRLLSLIIMLLVTCTQSRAQKGIEFEIDRNQTPDNFQNRATSLATTTQYHYQTVFEELASKKNQLSNKKTAKGYIDLFNPLGPNAQSMRDKSYSSIDESEVEKGLWIKLGSEKFLYKEMGVWIFDKEKNLVEADFNLHKKVLRRTVRALTSLEIKSAYAKNIIKTLQNSKNKFIIALSSITESYTLFPLPGDRLGFLNNNAYAFQVLEKESLMVDYAPFDQIGSGAEIRWTPELGIIKLAHELSHAYDANYGLLDDQLMPAYGEVMSAREIRALFHENTIRKELNIKFKYKANTGGALVWEEMPFTYPLPVSARY